MVAMDDETRNALTVIAERVAELGDALSALQTAELGELSPPAAPSTEAQVAVIAAEAEAQVAVIAAEAEAQVAVIAAEAEAADNDAEPEPELDAELPPAFVAPEADHFFFRPFGRK